MARKRSRSNTEQRFKDAVLDLIADSGCAKIGVNVVAEHAGSDKVLIYRYFGSFEGLLQKVAESRRWLPTAEELLQESRKAAGDQLRSIFRRVNQHVQDDAPSHQIALWRHALKNPLTEKYNEEWKALWEELATCLSAEMSYEDRREWERAIEIAALLTQSKIVGEPVDEKWIDFLCENLEPAVLKPEESFGNEDVLPTNLL